MLLFKKQENELLEYDVQKRAKAGTTATLRAVVAVYIMYLGSELIIKAGTNTSVPVWLGMLAGVLFIAAGTVFGSYTWKTYQRDLEAARLLPAEEEPAGEALTDGNSGDVVSEDVVQEELLTDKSHSTDYTANDNLKKKSESDEELR